MDTKQFFLENDIIPKIRAALEQIAVGQGYSVFEGLESGACNISIVYDGTNVSFHKLERLKPEPLIILGLGEPSSGDAAVATVPSEPIIVGPHQEPTAENVNEIQGPLPGVDSEPETKPKRRRGFKNHNIEGEQP